MKFQKKMINSLHGIILSGTKLECDNLVKMVKILKLLKMG